MIIRHGSENLTIKSLAAKVGLSEAAIYRHFRSKKDILLLLADYVGEVLVKDIDDAVRTEMISLASLESAFINHIASIEHRRGISFQVMSEIVSLGDKDLNVRACKALDRYIAKLAEMLKQAQKQGAIRSDIEAETFSLLISSLVQGLVNTWVLRNYSMDLEAEFRKIWKILLLGIIPNGYTTSYAEYPERPPIGRSGHDKVVAPDVILPFGL